MPSTKVKIGAALLAVLLIAVAVLSNYWLAPMIFEQNRQSGEQIANNALDSDVAIQNYRYFRSQWYDIQSQRAQIENYEQQDEQFHETWGDDPQDWTRSAQTRHGRIHDRITGARNMLEQMIAEYNARQSDATRAIFQCGLPYNIDEKLFIADGTGVEYTSQQAKSTEPPENPSECQFAQDPDNGSQ